jgi:hypothetical protein
MPRKKKIKEIIMAWHVSHVEKQEKIQNLHRKTKKSWDDSFKWNLPIQL